MKHRVISYSLFWCGRDEHALLYSGGLKAICRAHHTLFPGWEWRVHHDGSLTNCPKASVLLRYEQAGLVKLVDVGPESAICKAMLWRVLPVFDPSVEITICRDLDSLPTPRDAMAVAQFVESGAALHCMNDNPQHGIPIMGGLCGFRNSLFTPITGFKSFAELVDGRPLSKHGDDQLLLRDRVWPTLQNSLCEHRVRGFGQAPNAVRSYSRISGVRLPKVPRAVLDGGDMLIPYMGVSGFDPFAAEAFYNANGPAELMERIARAEA